MKDKGVRPCIPGRKLRGKPVRYDKRRYKRHKIEIMFGRLKGWRRVTTHHDRCPKTLLFASAHPPPSSPRLSFSGYERERGAVTGPAPRPARHGCEMEGNLAPFPPYRIQGEDCGMKLFAGLDVSLEKTATCVINEHGEILKGAQVAREPEALLRWISDQGGAIAAVGLEAGPLSQWLRRGLPEAVCLRRANLSC